MCIRNELAFKISQNGLNLCQDDLEGLIKITTSVVEDYLHHDLTQAQLQTALRNRAHEENVADAFMKNYTIIMVNLMDVIQDHSKNV